VSNACPCRNSCHNWPLVPLTWWLWRRSRWRSPTRRIGRARPRCRASYRRSSGRRRRRGCPQRPVKPEHLVRSTRWGASTTLPDAPTDAGRARHGAPRRGAARRGTKAAARVLPSCSVVRRDRAGRPTPFAFRAESHVGLNLDPVRARGEHRRSGQVYRKGGSTLREWLTGCAINLRAGKTCAVAIEEDVKTIGRSRTIEVQSISVDRLHVPSLASWHDKVISEIAVVWGRVGKCC
jgi:hypothetical protein